MSEQPDQPRRKRKLEAADISLAQREPWRPVDPDIADVYAVQAVYNGRATEEQQRRCMEFIIKDLCGVHRSPFSPAGDSATNFAAGKQFIGQTIASLIAVRINPNGEQG